ncbi:UDP-glycosyltransferase UGT33D8 [Operophtera brumata]|uniref:UDP-glycosyltransferase UGT33D8 n=1 Tax=Operophtera brumata TaxID=104452 RepID=A0A0L7LF59_OPEBR|nr:UDP-glycosyltransferase UGT33D8 [Operophtera brumata]
MSILLVAIQFNFNVAFPKTKASKPIFKKWTTKGILVSKSNLEKLELGRISSNEEILPTCLSVVSEAARILTVVPTPSISHQVVFRPLTQELAKRGHDVTIITTDPVFPKGQTPENLTEIDLHDMSYKVWRDTIFSSEITSGKSDDMFQQMRTFFPLMSKIFEKQMEHPDVKKIISNETQYDLLIIEAWVRPAMLFTHVFKNVPVILVSSLGGLGSIYDVIGAPSRPPLLYSTPLRQRIANLTLWDKVVELYNHYVFESIISNHDVADDKLIKRILGPDTPTIRELDENVHMLFLNVHPMWEMNRPVPPGVVYMGGIHQKPSKELPKELKHYLDSSKHGVIYISYGTNVSPSHLPPEKIQTLVKAFSQLPYDVLWKWDKDELPGQSKNIRISKWLPQSDLLKHPKVKLFITQGGLQSTDEAITASVPLIGMPMLGDQWYNVEQYVLHKVGIRVDMDSLTEETFNMERLRSVMHDQPQSALERAVWWTEHVLRHGGGRHLRAPAANMSWAEYLDVELLAVLALGALSIVASTIVLLYVAVSFVKNNLLSEKLKQICFSIISEAARILAVVPTPSISHQVVFRPLTQELARRGHDVTIITTDPVFPKGQTPENLTEIDLHDMSYKVSRDTIFSSEITTGKSDDTFQQMRTILSMMSKIFEKQMEYPEVKKILTNETQYDLLILEAWVRPALLFTHVFKNVPVILMSSLGDFGIVYDVLGAPSRPPLLYSTPLRQRIANLTLWDKVVELYSHYVFESIIRNHAVIDDKLIKSILGPDTPTLKELDKNVHMLFLNVHPMWNLNRPVPPSVVYLGGIHQKPSKEIPKQTKMQRFGYIVACLSVVSEAARILTVVPTPSISHQVVFRPLTQELAKRGHDVTIITTDPVFPKGQIPKNLTEIDIHDMSYKVWRDTIFSSEITSGKSGDMFQQMKMFLPLMSKIFEKQMEHPEVKKIISNRMQYDLLIIEAWVRPALLFTHVFKNVPVILMSSLGGSNNIYDVLGALSRPSLLYSTPLRQRIANLTLWDKVVELYNHYVFESIFRNHDVADDKLIKRILGPDTPTIRELDENVHMLFLNVHPMWEMNRPVPPGVVYMGGIHQKPSKEIPKLPYDVLWKWDEDELPGQSKNIRISKWLPQSDLLNHPKVKLFITQGGLQSTDEAITAGVPLIGMPMLGDQWYNVEQYVIHKIGLRVDLDSLTEETFVNAINTTALERAVWWTEHVLRHGGARHLRAPAANMSWAEYLDVELLAVLALGTLSIVASIIVALYVASKYIKVYKNTKEAIK